MDENEKNGALISQNMRAQNALRQAYYINQTRQVEDYKEWDANELSWIYQQFYNAEATITKMRARLAEDHPLQQARALEDWLTYPTKILNKQMQILIAAVQDMKTPLIDRTKTLKKDYHKQLTDIFYNRKVAYSPRFEVGYPIPSLLDDALTTQEQSLALFHHMNAVVRNCRKWLAEVVKKKKVIDYTQKSQFMSVINIFNTHLLSQVRYIETLKPNYEVNRNRWPYARFEEWDSFIQDVSREYEFRRAIPLWKMFKSRVDEVVGDFLQAPDDEKASHAHTAWSFFNEPTTTNFLWAAWDNENHGGFSETGVSREVRPGGAGHVSSDVYASDIISFVRESGWVSDIDDVLAKVRRVGLDNPAWADYFVIGIEGGRSDPSLRNTDESAGREQREQREQRE